MCAGTPWQELVQAGTRSHCIALLTVSLSAHNLKSLVVLPNTHHVEKFLGLKTCCFCCCWCSKFPVCRHEVHARFPEVSGYPGLKADPAGCLWVRHQDTWHQMLLPGTAFPSTMGFICTPFTSSLLSHDRLIQLGEGVLTLLRITLLGINISAAKRRWEAKSCNVPIGHHGACNAVLPVTCDLPVSCVFFFLDSRWRTNHAFAW